jgi:hypothetical protein
VRRERLDHVPPGVGFIAVAMHEQHRWRAATREAVEVIKLLELMPQAGEGCPGCEAIAVNHAHIVLKRMQGWWQVLIASKFNCTEASLGVYKARDPLLSPKHFS